LLKNFPAIPFSSFHGFPGTIIIHRPPAFRGTAGQHQMAFTALVIRGISNHEQTGLMGLRGLMGSASALTGITITIAVWSVAKEISQEQPQHTKNRSTKQQKQETKKLGFVRV